MSLLIQSSAGSIVVSLEDTGGSVATGLTSTNVQVDLKKSTDVFFVNKVLVATTLATASIGGGANGTVNLTVLGGAIGNTYTVSVTVPAGTNSLDVTKSGTALTVALATAAGVPDAPQNTATLIAAAVNALSGEISAVASGTGVDSISAAEGPTSFTGGIDGDFTELGGGSYQLDLSTTDTSVLGQFYVRFSGTTIRTVVESANVVVATPASPTPDLTIPTTTMFGYVRDISGSAVASATIAIRVLSVPTVLHPTTDGMVVSTELITSSTDSAGFFTIDLITGSQVDFFIPSANYRRTFTVPTASTNLFDLP